MRTPSSYRLEFVDSTLDAPIVQFVQTFDEVRRLAASGVVFKQIAQYDEGTEAATGINPHCLVNAKEKADLLRFVDFCEDSEVGGFTLAKDAVKRLAVLGLLRHVGFGRYEVTTIGDAFIEHFRPTT